MRTRRERDPEIIEQMLDLFPDCLDQRERQIIEARFGLFDGVKKTLQRIGDELGVSRERVRQIEKRALRKLTHPSRIKCLTGL